MGIIALIIFGFMLLAFVLIFRKTSRDGVQRIMKHNRDVPQLFKEKSAKIKYLALHDALKKNPTLLKVLEQLQRDHKAHLLDVEVYHDALAEMEQKHLKH